MSSTSKISKLKSLKALRPLEKSRREEDDDVTYIETFKKIKSDSKRVSIDKEEILNYEDKEINDFEGFHCEEWNNFEGFECQEGENLELNIDDAEEVCSGDETMIDLLELLPKPLEDYDENKASDIEEVEYFIVEKGSNKGNDMITDTWGHQYSYWRKYQCKDKVIINFRCIKRHSKDKSDCKCVLKIENYNEENMKILCNNEHNHQPDLSTNIKKQINMNLKRECMDKQLDNPSKVIHNVLLSNADHLNFYENGASTKIEIHERHNKETQKFTCTSKGTKFKF